MRKVIFLDIDGVLNTKYWDSMKVRDQYDYQMGYNEGYCGATVEMFEDVDGHGAKTDDLLFNNNKILYL